MQCVMQRKEGQKFVSKVSCLVCGSINRIDLGMLKSNLPSFINCAQLGFIQLQEIELQLRAENVGFKGIINFIISGNYLIFKLLFFKIYFQIREICTLQSEMKVQRMHRPILPLAAELQFALLSTTISH